MALILLVEDENLLRWALGEQLKRAGHTVHDVADLATASQHLKDHQPDVLLLDLALPDGHGLDFYESHLEQLEDTAAIVMTAVGQVDDAVRAMKLGAVDFLTKPVNQDDLIHLINRSLKVRSEQREVHAARQNREAVLSQDMIAESPAFLELLKVAETVAESEINSILIQGESGTGKNVFARHIHAKSPRRDSPILEMSCAAIPDQLMESELLGHEKGAFTDAKATRRGVFELAEGGTVVLDEIGELKGELQAKLLHVLEERRLRRVGGAREIFVDVRVIALTNRDLPGMVREGEFRQDLYYRLNIFPMTLLPLRERPEDILPLVRYFLVTMGRRYQRSIEGVTREAENRLLAYPWPGNVRELRNVIERAMILERSDQLDIKALVLDPADQVLTGSGPAEAESDDGGLVPLEEMERRLVSRAMRAAGDNQTRAAELLEITRDQLRYRIKKFEGG